MSRPTIKDLAAEAQVSVSTVNRVLSGHQKVREVTIQQVLAAAERIGFYGVHAIEHRLKTKRTKLRFGVLLQQETSSLYKNVGEALKTEAQSYEELRVELHVEYMLDLAPEYVAGRILALSENCDAIAVVAAQHPRISQAVQQVREQGKQVFAIISALPIAAGTHYIGLDNWKVGRMAAWAIHHMAKVPGPVSLFVGNHRYRCQEANEIGFRSYFREHAPEFELLDVHSTYESDQIAQDLTERLLQTTPNVVGLYVAGGGLCGALDAIRDLKPANPPLVIGHELSDAHIQGLLDGSLTMLLANQVDRLAHETIDAMVRAATERNDEIRYERILPFVTYTRENV